MSGSYKRVARFANFEAAWIPRSSRGVGGAALVAALASVLAVPPNVSAEVLAYVPQPAANQVTIFDTDSGMVVTQIPVGSNPLGVATDTAMQTVYVTNSGDGTVTLIDMRTQQVFNTVKVGRGPIGVAVTPDGSRVYVANTVDNTVSWFPAQTDTSGVPSPAVVTVATIAGLEQQPYGVAASSNGNWIYVTLRGSNKIAKISTTTNKVASTSLATGPLPSGIAETRIAYTRKGCQTVNCPHLTQPLLLAADSGASLSSAFNGQSDETFAPIPTGMEPVAVGIFPFIGSPAYIANNGSQSLTAIRPKPVQMAGILNYSTAVIKLPGDPTGAEGTPDGQFLWTVNNDGTMSQVNAASNKVVQSVPIGMPGIGLGQFIAPRFDRTDLIPLLKGTTDLSVKVDSTESILTIANAGPNTAKSVKLTVTLPAGVKFVNVKAAQGGCAKPAFGSSGQIACGLGELAVGEQTTVELGVDGVKASLHAAVSDALTNDPNSADNLLSWDVNNTPIPIVPVTAISYLPSIATDFQLEQIHGATIIAPVPSGSAWQGSLMVTGTLPPGATLDPDLAPVMGCFVQGTDNANGGGQIVTCPPTIHDKRCSGITSFLCSATEIDKYHLSVSLPAQVLIPVILSKEHNTKDGKFLTWNDFPMSVYGVPSSGDQTILTHSIDPMIASVAMVTNAKQLGWLKLPHKCHDPKGVNFAVLLGSCEDSAGIRLAQTILVASAVAVVGVLGGPILEGAVTEAFASSSATEFLVIASGDVFPDGAFASWGAL